MSSVFLFFILVFYATIIGLPLGQEKSGKTKKNYKSQVNIGVFEKSQEKSEFLKKKHQIL